ncbi:nucleotide binding protein [[Candida] boidinii]|nr:nucleotide binding protein [[Candida] boidinii]
MEYQEIITMSKPYPTLSQRGEQSLVEQLAQWSLANGLIMYPPNFQSYQANVAPVTLYPTPFPRDQFEKGISISKQYNSLYANIIIEKNWLLTIIKNLSKFDSDFTGKLYESYLKSIEIGIVQPVSLGLFRSDYMLDLDSNCIKQVEFNTVSVSFGGLSSKISELHKFLNDIGMYTDGATAKYYKDEELAVSKSCQELAKGLYEGVSYYNRTHDADDTVVLFVVQPNERNAFDQRAVEYSLLSQYGVRSKRVELPEVLKKVSIKGKDRRLYIDDEDGGDEVSVVYYRSGYGPQEYVEFPEAWDCRTQLETSLAIKCPSLLVQLSGAKKVQQLLTNDEIFSKFTSEAGKENESLKSTFVKIYPLDDSEEGLVGKKLAFEKPEFFVLKPQREGGGNNIYKEDIPKFLKDLNEEEWQGYILMELINPPIFKESVIFRNGELIKEGIISELGIFSCLLFNEATGDVIVNECCDHLLRSKTSSSNEGGVAAGFGCVDSLYLY